MKLKTRQILVSMCFVMSVGIINAASYYVDTATGSMSNNGNMVGKVVYSHIHNTNRAELQMPVDLNKSMYVISVREKGLVQ